MNEVLITEKIDGVDYVRRHHVELMRDEINKLKENLEAEKLLFHSFKSASKKAISKKNTRVQYLETRVTVLEGTFRFLLKHEHINPVSVNVVQSILKEGDENE